MTPELVLNAKKLAADIKAVLKEEGLKYHRFYTLNGKKYYKMKFYGIQSINFTNVVDIKRKLLKMTKNLNNFCEIEADFSLNLSGVLSLYVHIVREDYVHDRLVIAQHYEKTQATMHIDDVINMMSYRFRRDASDMLAEIVEKIYGVECVPMTDNEGDTVFVMNTTANYKEGIPAIDSKRK